MKFAHLADCHLGGWREEKLRQLGVESFKRALELCIAEKVDFVLIAGDLFDTALPPIDIIKEVVVVLRGLKDVGINVYLIAGSHDFSPSRKTMLEVLEKAGLCYIANENFVYDKSGAKIVGVYGLKGGLEKSVYSGLNHKSFDSESGFKIFMFHTALEEFKTKEMANMPAESVAILPKGFNYYAGGHVHYIFDTKTENGLLAYPGALFPNNFAELEEFKHGGFYIFEDGKLNYIPLNLVDTIPIVLDANGKTPFELENDILTNLESYDVNGKLITLRIEGTLKSGKSSDINFKDILTKTSEAYLLLKHIKISALEMNLEVKEDNEDELIKYNLENQEVNPLKFTFEKVISVINALGIEKEEGEKSLDFENRLIRDVSAVLLSEMVEYEIHKNGDGEY